MRGARVFLTVMLVSLLGAGCASNDSVTIGGHTFNNVTCGLIGAAAGATVGGAAGGGGGAGIGALSGAVLSQIFCGEEEMMEAEEVDTDGDGVPDDVDECPAVPGDMPNGCLSDRDGDGVPDIFDDCPDEPGPEDNNGCPVMVDKVVFIESVHFDFDSAKIKDISKAVLDARAVPAILNNPEIDVLVAGHTDSTGSDDYNNGLSMERAAAVREYLMSQGVPAENLATVGYGESRPIDTNDTKAGRANNRRVEFIIR